jgi:hypothetical protein
LKREVVLWAGAVLWLAAVVAACGVWERYDATPGGSGAPAESLADAGGGWRLTVFLHPHCPCSRETVRQAAALAEECPPLMVNAQFVRPAGTAPGWERGDVWAEAERHGIAVACDTDGGAARSAGAETSGTAVLTDPSGRVVFRGGLTPGRGRGGESAGRQAVLGWVRGSAADHSAPVFGCPLHNTD